MNTFGNLFRLTDFGESHGAAIGGVIDGMPAGLTVDFEAIDRMLARRRPGGALDTSRKEADKPEFLSGIYDGTTLGTPIAFIIRNADARPADYEALRDTFRPNHADYTYQAKYGIRDHRGGGRASARETAVRVVAGALAMQVLEMYGVKIDARLESVGGFTAQAEIEDAIRHARSQGDTLGSVVACVISGVPVGLGEPLFGKAQAVLASAMMSINAAKGFEYGDGFAAASMRGSECIDTPYFDAESARLRTRTNHSGGIQGGITTGEDITFRVAFKPIATLGRPVDTLDTSMQPVTLDARGRHDVCVGRRAVPVVEAMAAMTILDLLMLDRAEKHLMDL